MEHLLDVLYYLEEFEARMADLYSWFSDLFAKDTEASAFFARMSRDEISHRDTVRYQVMVV